MKRAIVIVIDSMGCGAMPDVADYNDIPECNTLANVADFCGGLQLPVMQKMGLGNIIPVKGVPKCDTAVASFAKMQEISRGKDTTTGHWEIAGLVLDEPFQTFPKGFPEELLRQFVEKTGCGDVLGNIPASGTQIIEDLGEKHRETGFPIVYTSADSVFQIACDVDVVPLSELYKWCGIARELLNDGYNVSRVIARPFRTNSNGAFERISKDRRDYSLEPFGATVLNEVKNQNGRVFAIGKIEDIFVKSGITHAIHTGKNAEGLEILLSSLRGEFDYDKYKISEVGDFDKEFIFLNLVDTDMLFGHRNDARGYGCAIEEVDRYLAQILPLLGDDDLLFVTADHGCDPTVPGTDHTREYVPLLMYSSSLPPQNLGLIKGFGFIADKIRNWLNLCNM